MDTAKHLAITACGRCGQLAGRTRAAQRRCEIPVIRTTGFSHPGASAPSPDTARRGAARAREALGLTREDEAS